jgi:hypothetical protein
LAALNAHGHSRPPEICYDHATMKPAPPLRSNSRFTTSWLAILCLIFLLVGTQTSSSQVQTEVWNNGGKGNWFTPTNWTPFGVPGPAQTAVVNTGIAQIFGGNATVNNLSIGVPFGALPAGGGTVEVGGGHSLVVNNLLTIGPNGTLQIDDGAAFRVFGAIQNNGNIIMSSGSFFGVFGGTGSITKIGPGTLQENASLDPAAHVFVNGGTLIDASASPGIIVVTGPTSVLRVNSGITLGITPIVTNGGTVDNFGLITAGINYGPSGGNLINESGGQIFGNINLGNGANTAQIFTGSTINGGLNLGPSTGSTLILDGAGTQNLSQAITGTITNSGSLTKQGSGTWIVDEALNAPVSTKVLAGILQVNQTLTSPVVTVEAGGTLTGPGTIVGTLFNSGFVQPGDAPGTLTISGNYTQSSAGTLNIRLASTSSFDRLIIGGHATLDGTLRLTLLNGFKPTSGQFNILTAGLGTSGTFRTVISPLGDPFQVAYGKNGIVTITPASAAVPTPRPTPAVPHVAAVTAANKNQVQLGDGTPISTTAMLTDASFYGFGTPADRALESGKNGIAISFDAAEFDIKGQKGEVYTLPISGGYKLTDCVRLDYVIPLQYVKLPHDHLFQEGLVLNLPINVIRRSDVQPWTWDVTPTVAMAEAGTKEFIGGAALTNVISYRCGVVTLTYGNYMSFYEGKRWTTDDINFPKRVSQQIMKNGLKVTVPFGKDWVFDAYGIYTQYFQSAAISSYYTIGGELGRRFSWNFEGQRIDLGFFSLGFYAELGNRYSSGHIQLGTAWNF